MDRLLTLEPPGLPPVWRIRRVEGDAGRDGGRPVAILHTVRAGRGALQTIESVAAVQAGVLHRRQLRALGYGPDAVGRRIRSGRLVVVYPSVLAIGGRPLDDLARRYAALLQAGANSVLGHDAAGAVWEMLAAPPPGQSVTVIARHVRDQPGLRAHRVLWLDARDVRMCGRLPVTAPARTLIDLAADAPPALLEEALARARVRRLVNDRELQDALRRAPLRTGAARLRRLLNESVGQAVSFSVFERELIRLLEAAGLPLPRFNVVRNGHRVDAVWDDQRVVLECDGWAFHGDRRSFERDRRRDQDHLAAGYRTLRITWRQLHEEPARLVALLASVLAGAQPR